MQHQPPFITFATQTWLVLLAFVAIKLLTFAHFDSFKQEQLAFIGSLVAFSITVEQVVAKAIVDEKPSVTSEPKLEQPAVQAPCFDFPSGLSSDRIGFLREAQRSSKEGSLQLACYRT